MINVMRINKDMRQRKRRLNKMHQWWLGTSPSGRELAGEADSPAKVQGVPSYSLRSPALVEVL